MSIVGGQSRSVPIFNQRIPDRLGPRSLQFDYNLVSQDELVIDLQYAVDAGVIDQVQGIYFNNSATAVDVRVFVEVTNQTLILPGNTCGYLPLLVPEVPKITLTGSGATGQIILLNVPMPAIVYTV